MIGGAVAVALPNAIPGNGHSQTPAEASNSPQLKTQPQAPQALSQPSPRFTFSDALQAESTGAVAPPQAQIAPSPASVDQASSDSLLLALVALGSAQTDAEVDASVQRIEALGLPAVAESTATPTATPSGNPDCPDSASHPAFCVYTVKPGDTLSGIAIKLGLKGNGSVSAIDLLVQSNKPDVVSSDHIEPGQNLRIPQQTGIIHTVITPESLAGVAASYGVSADDITASPFNDIPGGKLALGQNVFIPDPQQVPADAASAADAETPTPEPTVTPTDTPTAAPTDTPAPTSTPKPKASPAAATPKATATPVPPTPTATKAAATATSTPSSGKRPSTNQGLYIWPAQGPISSYFGPSHPLGIDIDLYNNTDASIVAARSGIVTFAGGDPCCSYGYYVVIDHGDGQQTLYAHLSVIGVHQGQSVGQGDIIGIGGRTGYATGIHLHFELHINGQVVDPLLYLPTDPETYGP